MNRYKVTKQLGDGTYGCVLKAANRQTGEIMAIKKMKKKFFSWEECMQLRELKVMNKSMWCSFAAAAIWRNNKMELCDI